MIVDAILNDKTINITDRKKMYSIPEEASPYENDLFRAHDTSHIYNQLTVRVAAWGLGKDCFNIITERTTFYKSLITNRALDYRLPNEMTLRDLLQYGPFVPSLMESCLSNHLGVNGFIITSDGKIPIVRRKRVLSIGKHTYGPSVGASLKTKYCLDDEHNKFTMDGILKGIRNEITGKSLQ